MSRARCLLQWCVIGLLVLSPDIFSATAVVDSDDGVFGCSSGDGVDFGDNDDDEKTFSFDFSNSARGWTGGFADYPFGQEAFFELLFDLRPLLPDLNPNRNGLFISGANRSDDLFMFVKRRVTGLTPGAAYSVVFEVSIGSEAGSDCAGIGGSPAIALKAGASATEPLALPDANGFVRMNIDIGNQSQSGADARVLGDIGVDVDCANPVFKAKQLRTSTGDLLTVTADDDGGAWLLVGTDSSFEGATRLFYTAIEARFSLR
ncbi:MAG: PEP-CTERM sorting domain-containing protein [Gammaproteobacteria bacterium]